MKIKVRNPGVKINKPENMISFQLIINHQFMIDYNINNKINPISLYANCQTILIFFSYFLSLVFFFLEIENICRSGLKKKKEIEY